MFFRHVFRVANPPIICMYSGGGPVGIVLIGLEQLCMSLNPNRPNDRLGIMPHRGFFRQMRIIVKEKIKAFSCCFRKKSYICTNLKEVYIMKTIRICVVSICLCFLLLEHSACKAQSSIVGSFPAAAVENSLIRL